MKPELPWKLTRGDGTNNGDKRQRGGVYDADGAWIKPERQIRCCGGWVGLRNFTNTCGRCGADYNTAGSRLAPRAQWGEETGESVADILSVDNDEADFGD